MAITRIGFGNLKPKVSKPLGYPPARISKKHGWGLGEPLGEGYLHVTIQGAFQLQGVSDGYSIECNSTLATIQNRTITAEWAVPLPWEWQLDTFRELSNQAHWEKGHVYLEKWHARRQEEDWQVFSDVLYDPRVDGLRVALPPAGLPLWCICADNVRIVVAEGWGARASIGDPETSP
jgi:hypothetical protein